MKKELPKIFKKDVSSSHDNNKKVYYAGLQDDKKKEYRSVDTPISQDSLNSVETEIRKLFKSSRYVFNIHIRIETDTKTYDTKVAGKLNDNLITVDGDIIPIKTIRNIIIKDRF